jgi:hypothetical protein
VLAAATSPSKANADPEEFQLLQSGDAAAAVVGSRGLLRDREVEEDRLAEASQWGSLAVVELDCAERDASDRLQKLALHPAVALVVIRGELPADFKLSQVAPNLLLAQPISDGNRVTIRPWAKVLWREADDPLSAGRIAGQYDLPRRRPLPRLAAPRRSSRCLRRLQGDLASVGQFADTS